MANCFECLRRNVARQAAESEFNTVTLKLIKRPDNDSLKAQLASARQRLNFAKSQEVAHKTTCKGA